jgi:hypothetical protein
MKFMNDHIVDYQNFTTIDTSVEERRKKGVGDIWSNSAKCRRCNDEIRSRNKHDYVTCKCGAISVDGGSWYSIRSGIEYVKDLIVYFNDLEKK